MDDAPARGGFSIAGERFFYFHFAETLLELEFIRRGLCSGFELTGSIQDMYVLFHILIFSVTMDESNAQKGILNFVEFMFPLFYRLTFLDLMCCGGAALLHRLPGCDFKASEIVLLDFPVYDGFWPLLDVQPERIPEDGGYEYELWKGIVGSR